MFKLKKFTKSEVGFEHPAKGMNRCATCKHFEKDAPRSCEVVLGEIQPEDWCKKYVQG